MTNRRTRKRQNERRNGKVTRMSRFWRKRECYDSQFQRSLCCCSEEQQLKEPGKKQARISQSRFWVAREYPLTDTKSNSEKSVLIFACSLFGETETKGR